MDVLQIITSASDLVTSKEQTRAGFITFALEKNKKASPLVAEAKSLHAMAKVAKTPAELLNIAEIRKALLTASGLSDKSLQHLTEADKTEAINRLIKEFLEPEGEYFVDALVYRYLLIKGDSLGGSMRNLVGALAQQKLIRTFISNLTLMGIDFLWTDVKSKEWYKGNPTAPIEGDIKAIYWNYNGNDRILAFNLTIPLVGKNVDITLFDAKPIDYNEGKIVRFNDRFVMAGELKGGIDPAGADEHWKTGNTALNRIRNAFDTVEIPIKTAFIAAAIEDSMSEEIFNQLKSETLSYAANLTVDDQLVHFCDWAIKLQ
jgi:type II restriction enzyme